MRYRKLRLCVTCAVQAGVLKHDDKKKEFVLNVENNDIKAALQRAKKIAICGDCALDGPQHEGHKTMQLAVLENNLEDRIHEDGRSQCKKFTDKLKGAFNSLKKRFQRSDQLLAFDANCEVHHEGHTAQQSTVLQSNNEDQNTTSSEGRINQLQNIGCQTVLDLRNTLAETLKKLKNKRIQYNASPTEERKKDLKDYEEKIEQIMHDISLAAKKLDISNLINPILVTNRQQSAREPLLIGLFNPKDIVWTPHGRMPKSDYAMASNKLQTFIIGGLINGSWLQEVELYDTNTKSRKSCAPMERGRARTSAGFHKNKMYVAGGYNSSYMSSVEVFDPDHETWEDGPSLQRPRADGAVVSCNGALFVLGGFNGKQYEEKIEKLMEQTQKFEIVGEMQGSRARFGACEFRGRIYIAGGWNGTSDTLKSVRSYDPITNSWRDEPSMNNARKYFTLRATSNAIYAIRGCPDNINRNNKMEKFDVEGQKWDLVRQVSK